mgnify:FL=1|tara:strand:- start:860 stop:1093 length:234 start_codon:yes stop_codon:yes gene_type:complete
MGFGRRTPRKSQEQLNAEAAEKARLKKEKEAQEFATAEQKRIQKHNLGGFRSLLSEQEGGLNLGGKVKKMGSGSIRY